MAERPENFGQRLLAGWVGGVARHAILVMMLCVVAVVGALYFTAQNLSINTNTDDLLSEELPFRQRNRERNAAFPRTNSELLVVLSAATADAADRAADRLVAALRAKPKQFEHVFYPQGDGFFRRKGLLYLDVAALEDLSDRLADVQPLLLTLYNDLSLRGLAEVLIEALEAKGDEAAGLKSALNAMAETVEQVGAGQPASLAWRELMSGRVATPTDRRKLVTVKPRYEFGSLEPAAEAIRAIRAAGAAAGSPGDGMIRVRITGGKALLQDELRSVREGMGLVGALSLVLVIGLLWVGLASVRLIVPVILTLVFGLLWNAFFATVAIGELNIISVAFAVLFLGLSVDFGIHFSLRYKEAVAAGKATEMALRAAAAEVGGALALCALAAAIAFFSFLPTAYRGVSELGLIAGVGMFIALFANLTVLPAMLALVPVRDARADRGAHIGRTARAAIDRRAQTIIGGAVLLALLAATAVPFARFDDDPMNLRNPKAESVATLFDLLDDPTVQPYRASVLAKDLDAAASISARARKLPGVDTALTVQDFVPEGQQDKLEVIEAMAIPFSAMSAPVAGIAPIDADTRRRAVAALRAALGKMTTGPLAAAAARMAKALDALDGSDDTVRRLETALVGGLPRQLNALLDSLQAGPVTLATLPEDLRGRYVAADGRALVAIHPAGDLRRQDARRHFVAAVQAAFPGANGGAVTIDAAGRAVIQAFKEAALYAAVLIVILLLVVLRSIRDMLLVLAPLGLAALLTVAATVVFAIPFNFANVIVLPLLFGLGVASGIHIVLRHRTDRSGQFLETSTPRAVLFSALTTIGSFCALALSTHRGTASMGMLLTIAITVTTVCTMIVLPALLALLDRRSAANS
ncbi:MAG: MMPL family transporter [Alphaproteobacteria bacterium]|nr:MMPL family transporter [Alphaproteobacteria bacterium]